MRLCLVIISYLFTVPAQAQGFAFFSREQREPLLTIADAILALDPDLVITQAETAVTMLGAQQKSWLIDKVNTSVTMFVVIASSKKLGTTGVTDAWNYYNTKINEVLSAITKTGVLWISGDYHWPVVVNNTIND